MGCLRETSQCQVRRNSDLNNTLWQACQPVDIAGVPFTGVPQLRNHILAQVCPVLHGATASGRDYGQQPALPVGESLESTPLKDRASTAVYLEDGGWRALADSPGFQQVALSHCPLCHQWVANASGQVKKHITQKHKRACCGG